MGRYTSWFSIRRRRCPAPAALLLDVHGDLRRSVDLPVTAAELMLEEPFHAVVPLEDLRRARRILPMSADEQLAAGQAYVLVPLERVNAKVQEAEMAALDAACGKRGRRRGSPGCSSRVLPAAEEGGEKVGSRLDGVSGGGDRSLTSQQAGNCRKYWRPVLETISEMA